MGIMKKFVVFLAYLYGMSLFLPFLAVLALSGAECFGGCRTACERYVPLAVGAQISEQAPAELIKAQTVLARTNYEAAGMDEKQRKELYQNLAVYYSAKEARKKFLKNYGIYQEAAQAAGEILTWKEEARWVPYHQVSSGHTRSGEEVLHDSSYAYLASVKSLQDRNAENFLQTFDYPTDFQKNISIVSKDSSGYVMEVRVGGELMSGEQLRKQLELPSSAFSVKKTDGKLRIFCKGTGHGLGLSQYGAGVMAKEGQNYIEILTYYFPGMEIH
ncbi:MAG: SpoIID/LytB domain-containing protein [Eubacteriales bacterium]|nr:SpoIID/LytB domain-containing protein [Eubacteriales bacterium]